VFLVCPLLPGVGDSESTEGVDDGPAIMEDGLPLVDVMARRPEKNSVE